jgi:hypothetical protein
MGSWGLQAGAEAAAFKSTHARVGVGACAWRGHGHQLAAAAVHEPRIRFVHQESSRCNHLLPARDGSRNSLYRALPLSVQQVQPVGSHAAAAANAPAATGYLNQECTIVSIRNIYMRSRAGAL